MPVRSVLVLKKLGDELLADFVRVLQFLGVEEGMRVLVEPHEYIKLVGRAGLGFIDTYTPAEASKCGQLEWCLRACGLLLTVFKQCVTLLLFTWRQPTPHTAGTCLATYMTPQSAGLV